MSKPTPKNAQNPQPDKIITSLARIVAYLWFSLDLIAILAKLTSKLTSHTAKHLLKKLAQTRQTHTHKPQTHRKPKPITTYLPNSLLKQTSLLSIVAVLFLTGFAWNKGGELWPQSQPQQSQIPQITSTPNQPPNTPPIWPPSQRQMEAESLALMEAWESKREIHLTLNRGNTLSGILIEYGIKNQESEQIIAELSKVFNPRKLRAGQKIVLRPVAGDSGKLKSLHFEPERSQRIEVRKLANGKYQSAKIDKALAVQEHWAEGEIQSSLYLSAVNAGVPLPVLARAIQIFSFSVDFQRDIQPGDQFALFYQTWHDELGQEVSAGDLLYGELILRKKQHRAWAYEIPGENLEYYDQDGKSVRKGLMRTPIDGARLSSGFGMRKHPILGYNRMHRGVDFAAPRGTPIYAAGNGTIEAAGRNGGYGNYIRIQHSGGYKTAYAHLNGFAKGIKRGVRVNQGDIIAYVGSTGRSTGPHLHYEILLGGEQLNPASLDLPSGQSLNPQRLKNFHNAREVTFAKIQRARGDKQILALAQCAKPLLRCNSTLE
ncbi:MAG: peptidoglycan DD-metalloendopeptidase family protein [Alphaproteobacteria bacterium]